MVLINELTVEQINAALLHLQRSKDETVGGEKGTTIQNISISNSGGGGGNNVDYSGTIKNLANLITKNTTAIDKNTSDIAKLKSDFSNIEKSVEDTLQGLADNGISDLSFDPLTKQLTITTNDGDIYQTIIEQDISYLSYDSATNKLILTTGNQTQEITLPYIKASEKGSANGVATLDENGRVPYSQLPESAMEFLGQWNASTNTPHLADGTGTNGDFYIVSAGGTVNLGTAQDPHIITFSVNDRIVYEGDIAQWVRLPAGQVSSVNGQSGEVTLTANDIEYSTGVSIKDKIDANAVQSDWNVSDTTSLAYIKNKPTIPASPVQSDWNVTDTTSLAYIKNKPTIPSTPTLVCCAKCVYLDTYTGNADRPIMVTSGRGTTGYNDQGVVTSGCDFTYNPATGQLKLKSNGKTACISHINASYLHIYTDAPAIAMNQYLLMAGSNNYVCGNLCGTASCACKGYNSSNATYQAFGCNAFSNASLGNTYWSSISSASGRMYNVVLSDTKNYIGITDTDSTIKYCPFNRTLITGCLRAILEGKVGKSGTNFCDTQVGKNLHYICFCYNIPQSTLFSCLRTITCCYDSFSGTSASECYYHGAIGSRARTETIGSREIGSIVVLQCCVQFRDNANSVVMTARCNCGSQIGSDTSLLVMFN